MQIALRSSLTAGVAVLGAGVIVASPLTPPVPELHLASIHSGAMNLAAAVTPIDVYSQVLHKAVTNFQTLTTGADPALVLKQIVANQISGFTALSTALQTAGGQLATAVTTQIPGLLQTAFDHLGAGDITGVVNALLTVPLLLTQPAINLLPALEQTLMQPLQNLVKVAKVFSDPVYDSLVAVGLVGPLITGLGATAVAVQNVIAAAAKGDLQQVGNAILTAPALIADGVLNGGYGPDLGPLVGGGFTVLAGGLFTPGGFVFTPDGNIVLNVAGPIATLQALAKSVAAALKPAIPLSTQSVRTHVAAVPAANPATSTPIPANVTHARPTAQAKNTAGHSGATVNKASAKTAASVGSSRSDRRAAGAHSGK